MVLLREFWSSSKSTRSWDKSFCDSFIFQVAKRRKNLLNYMLFLRVTPTLPNTFINLASPIVDVPYHIFFLATLIGLIPAAYVSVRVCNLLVFNFYISDFLAMIEIHWFSINFVRWFMEHQFTYLTLHLYMPASRWYLSPFFLGGFIFPLGY